MYAKRQVIHEQASQFFSSYDNCLEDVNNSNEKDFVCTSKKYPTMKITQKDKLFDLSTTCKRPIHSYRS